MGNERIEIDKANIETNSGGGPIGQWIAIDYPEKVISLVLGETMAHVDQPFRKILNDWLEMCKNNQWYDFHIDSIVKTLTANYYGRYKWAFPLLRLMPNPKHPDRMIRILEGLLELDNRPYLHQIHCPTLVIGGDVGLLTRPEQQKEMADLIPNSKQVVIPGVGHGENQEALKEHEKHVLSFYEEVELMESVNSRG